MHDNFPIRTTVRGRMAEWQLFVQAHTEWIALCDVLSDTVWGSVNVVKSSPPLYRARLHADRDYTQLEDALRAVEAELEGTPVPSRPLNESLCVPFTECRLGLDSLRLYNNNEDDTCRYQAYPLQELYALHPDMEAYLDGLSHQSLVPANALRATLGCWGLLSLPIVTVRGITFAIKQLVNDKLGIQGSGQRLFGDWLTMNDRPANTVRYVYQENIELSIPFADLENTFPGWRDRYAVAQPLGLTGEELARAVFSQFKVETALTLPAMDGR